MNRNGRGGERLDSILLFGIAVFAGLLNWHFLRDVPFLAHPIIDAGEYLAEARAMATGIWSWDKTPTHGPVYPVVLIPFVKLFQSPLPLIYAMQILLTGFSALLIRSAGIRLHGRAAGNTAALLLAVAPPLLYFEVQVLPVILQIFLHSVLVRFLVCGGRDDRKGVAIAGAAAGLSFLTHPGCGIAILLVAAFLFIRLRPFRRAVLFLTLLLIPLIPVSLLNLRAGEGPFPIAGNAGLNLYVGNGEGSDGTAHIRPGYEWERLTAMPLLAGKEGSVKESRFFTRRVLESIRRNPAIFFRRLAAKALLFASSFPIDASQDFEYFRERSFPLRILFFDGILLVSLAVAFLITRSAWRRDRLIPAVAFIGYWVGVTLTVYSIRYRAPVWPFLVLLAAPALVTLRSLPRGALLRTLAVAAALIFLVEADPFGYRRVNPVRTDYNLGRLHYMNGNLPVAANDFHRLLAGNPGDPDVANALGILEMKRPGSDGGVQWFQRALQLAPDYADARFNLALVLMRGGKYLEAETELDLAIALSPDHSSAIYAKGILLERRGETAGAERHYRESIRRKKTNMEAWNALGVLLARRGERGEAAKCFRWVLKLDPANRDARNNMKRLFSCRDPGVP